MNFQEFEESFNRIFLELQQFANRQEKILRGLAAHQALIDSLLSSVELLEERSDALDDVPHLNDCLSRWEKTEKKLIKEIDNAREQFDSLALRVDHLTWYCTCVNNN